jgi:CRISPR-associated endonuclease/helicase Cas3
VSTQLVEAGVDVDFPVVYRAMAGLDALAQAGGRCNREGLLRGRGQLRVFVAPTSPPPGILRAALAISTGMLSAQHDVNIFAPGEFETYFSRLYASRDRDTKGIQGLRARLHFREVASAFRLIEDDWSAPIVVPYGAAEERLAELERLGPSRDALRSLQPFVVTVPIRLRDEWLASGAARTIAETVVALDPAFAPAYDARYGLVPERVGVGDPARWVIDG